VSLALISSIGASAQSAPSRGSQITVSSRADLPRAASTLVDETSASEWKTDFLRELARLVLKSQCVSAVTLRHFLMWFSEIPGDLPRPFVAVSEDGSIGLEWDIEGRHLHVNFDQDADEVYFASPEAEWEATTSAGEMSEAMRAIALAARE
jgi:hypothetical protein